MIRLITDFFPTISISSIADNLNIYELKYIGKVDVNSIDKFNVELYNKFNSELIKYDYEWSFEIEEINYSISQSNFVKIETVDLEEITELNINLQIFKKGINVVIYDENEFIKNIKTINLEDLLKLFGNKFQDGIIFYNSEDKTQFSSSYIGYNLVLKEKQTFENEFKISNQCHFNNFSELKFTPNDFYLNEINNNNFILNLVNKIFLSYIYVHIFDKSEFKKNNINLKISGFKTSEYNLEFDKLKTDSLPIYEKIFNWIYSEKNKIEDKIGIARNILSIYLKDDDVVINESTFNSILSANNTYIKGNISKYIEARNKIHEQVEQVSSKVNSSLETFYSNFQKSIFVFISFYLTIFVLKVYAKNDVTSLINKEATIMALGLLILSFLFLLFSVWILSLEKGRINQKYNNIKNRSLDLLLKEDIDIILKDDNEYNDEIKFLDKRRNLYIKLWISTLIVFLIVLFTTSDYINFKYLNNNNPIEKTEKIKDINKCCKK
ncbi:hypothetical protein [Flavobacterium davisii]|uniref:hypothetical protein n=1 Tax=Flavobacterium davisii TaxID=2906077 RepID=UPI0035CFF7CE